MESWEHDPWNTDSGMSDSWQHETSSAEDLYGSIQRGRAMSDLFGESSGRGILGDSAADWQLSQDIASGMDIREALDRQRNTDSLIGDRRSHGVLSDMLTDDLIARDVESGMDIGEAIAREESWADFWDDLFNG